MSDTIFDSWEILNDTTIIKKTDWSFFEYKGSGIPKGVFPFFKTSKLSSGDKLYITLKYNGQEYNAYIEIDKTPSQRARIFWFADLGNRFTKLYPQYKDKDFKNYPLVTFEQISPTHYNIFFAESIDESSFNNSDYIGREGKKDWIQSIHYERNAQLRQQALSIHGYTCVVCGFNFFETYGEIGRGFIHIHHINPLSETGEQIVNPKTDLVPVCPNCHYMIHRDKGHILSIKELKQILKENRK